MVDYVKNYIDLAKVRCCLSTLGLKRRRRKISDATRHKKVIRQISLVINGKKGNGRRRCSDDFGLCTDDATDETDSTNEAKESKIWKTKAATIDKYSMVFFPTLFFIIMGVYCVIYIFG